jgi:hypothetical protein
VGITVYVLHPRGAVYDTLAVLTRKVRAEADSASFSLAAVPEVLDTIVVLIPATVGGQPISGSEVITASVTASSGAQGVAAPVTVNILPSATDNTAPQVSFNAVVGPRLEVDDSFSVSLQATDQTRVDTLGLTVYVLHPRAGGPTPWRCSPARCGRPPTRWPSACARCR